MSGEWTAINVSESDESTVSGGKEAVSPQSSTDAEAASQR